MQTYSPITVTTKHQTAWIISQLQLNFWKPSHNAQFMICPTIKVIIKSKTLLPCLTIAISIRGMNDTNPSIKMGVLHTKLRIAMYSCWSNTVNEKS